jgi:hypothetical protein
VPTSFTRTRTQIGAAVLRKLGIVAAGATPLSADTDVVYEAMDLRLKEMHRLGIYWRKVDPLPISFTLSAGVNSASATADILFPVAMSAVNNSSDDPIEIVGKIQYTKIEDKTEQGVPLKALWHGDDKFTFWPVPTANTTVKLLYEKIADDTSAGAAPDLDVAMMRWFRDLICYDVGDDFGISEQKMMRLKLESEIAERNIRKLGVQHTDYSTVRVDDYDDSTHRETDY